MKHYLIVLLLIAPSLGRPGAPGTPIVVERDEIKEAGDIKTPAIEKPAAETLPLIKDDLRIHQEIAETILKARTDPKNQGQNVVISASVSVNTDKNVIGESPQPKLTAAKRNDDIVPPTDIVHHGVAVPLTMEEIEKEMEMANRMDSAIVESSTSKEGISTWILLNGSGPTVQPDLKSSQYRAEIDKKVDKIARIKEGQITKQTVDISNAINKRNEAKLKQRPKITTTTTTTTANPGDLLPVYDEDDYEDEDDSEMPVVPVATIKAPTKLSTKAPVNKKSQNAKPNAKPTTTKTTEMAPTEAPNKPETATFLILEPKEAGFDLPQDRSPNGNAAGKKKKRPNANNKNNNNATDKNKKKKNDNKKKPAADSDVEVKNSTKSANAKQPQKNIAKPLSTQIYNYFAREVMPTVGVGLVGLVVAGGLASYLLGGPFGALRRSYDIQDRKDDLYHFNNEEYAGQADGQNEEDMFGKVIAGMPSSSLYRNNIRYQSSPYRPNPNQIYQQPAPQMHPAYNKYGPYNSRNRYNSGYRPGGPPTAGPGYPSQYQQQQQQQSYPPPQYRYNAAAAQSSNQQPSQNIKTVYAQSQPPSSASIQLSPVYSADRSDASSSILEQTQSSGYSVGGTMDNQLQHRSQFVVGTTVPDTPAVTEKDVYTEDTEGAEGSTAIPVPEHGPRRRKRSTERKISSKKINDNEIDNENDIDSNLYAVKDQTEPIIIDADVQAAITNEAVTTSEVVTEESVTAYPGQGTPFFDFFRRVIEMKVRYGLSFLQNTTNAFQRYLSGVQERVNSSPIFNPKY